jgi:hypothetical protein
VLKVVIFKDLGAKSEEWLGNVTLLEVELLEKYAEVNLETLFFVSKESRQVIELLHVARFPKFKSEVNF